MEALRVGVSAGEYLMGLHRGSLARVGSVKVPQPERFESHRPIKSDPVFVPDEVVEKEPVVEKSVIEGLKGKVDAIAGGRPFNPYSKARQVGKKEPK